MVPGLEKRLLPSQPGLPSLALPRVPVLLREQEEVAQPCVPVPVLPSPSASLQAAEQEWGVPRDLITVG